MNNPFSSQNPPEPAPVRARVPDSISGGAFSTGAIVVTGNTEFLIDFVRNLGKPNQIVARIVMPHTVMPQFVDALAKNVELYQNRFGPLPPDPIADPVVSGSLKDEPKPTAPANRPELDGLQSSIDVGSGANPDAAGPEPSSSKNLGSESGGSGGQAFGSGAESNDGNDSDPSDATQEATPPEGIPVPPPVPPPPVPPPPVTPPSTARRASAEEVYDDLKIPDELLSGQYANAVMIGHGPHEFSFDFITSFYPQSSVSARVFMAAGQITRLLDSMRTAWLQVKPRLIQNPGFQPRSRQNPSNPAAGPSGETPGGKFPKNDLPGNSSSDDDFPNDGPDSKDDFI
jgi:hypothetical protein